ncbi:MAG: 2-oxo acid dehydrogenase subunit E2 [Deltaproteobacteria bacterium]|nr:2-oxo acid dehydrogenase subunit E2 [Deltaproteobacteria bacterium]
MFVFHLPEIGEGVVEGEIVQWLVKVGDVVSEDQPVCEIMTDKATVEISTPKGGRVVQLFGKPGDVIKVHSTLANIDTDGSAPRVTVPEIPVPAPVKAAPAPAPLAVVPPAPVAAPAPVVAEVREGNKALATPAVRRHARELELDIHAVPGSGKGGRVTHDDLARFTQPAAEAPAVEAPVAAEPVIPVAVPQAAPQPTGSETHIPIIGLRRKIAQQMVKAYSTAPHFTYVDEIDMTDLVALRGRLKARAEAKGVKLTYIPFIMKALAAVFREFPNVNANVIEDPFTLVVKGDVNIGVATDSPQGLYVPVIKNVERKSVLQLAAELQDVTTRVREGKVRVDELQGGTFTITSVGNIGGVFATPILNHPEVAILGVNKIVKRPVVRDDQIVIREMLYLSPSFDHRIIDGAVAARFVSALKALLEDPDALFLEMA